MPWMVTVLLVSLVLACGASLGSASADALLRPPATPLVTHDPYFSVWSFTDELHGSDTVHWTGKPHPLSCLVRVDGQSYRLMGAQPADAPPMRQVALEVHPTRTVYRFRTETVEVQLTFLTPALAHDLDVLARPVTYLIWSVQSLDASEHAVQIYCDASALLAVNTPDQVVQWERGRAGSLDFLRLGTVDQPILAKKGDDLRIDWGWLYLAALNRHGRLAVVSPREREAFAASGAFPEEDDTRIPRAAGDATPALACVFDLGKVGRRLAQRTVLLGYDDLYSIEYMRTRLRPYWRRSGQGMEQLLRKAEAERARLITACVRFDAELEEDLLAAGGEAYRRIGVLAYRQALAGNKLAADAHGRPLLFPKENFSNGCIGTVDVIYPMAPLFLLTSPTLAKAMLVPVLDYAASPRWRWPFAPHDLGTYPKANGQVYGGGERTEENQMPVEESGNMLILMAAIARVEGNAHFAERYWTQLTQWAEYLREKGFDPEHQLCTDDFAGHLAHNVNLSAKAIMGLASYAYMCELRGLTETAAEYAKLARKFAAQWIEQARDDGRFRLAFDRPGTWSQKYNLVWDRILGFNMFPEEVLRTEVAWYRRVQNRYGVPLDNQRDYTKLDWVLWSAALTGDRADFDALIAPVALWLNETPSRVPLTDWYDTKTGACVGFRARPVVGGVFLRLLQDGQVWRKWAMRDRTPQGEWAPFPQPPVLKAVVPAADHEQPPVWRYTLQRPPEGWERPDFDDGSWSTGQAGFGRAGTPGSIVRTKWETGDIWLRRTFELKERDTKGLRLWVHHDEDAEIYINGVLAARLSGYVTEYDTVELSREALAALREGRNTLAVHCRQTTGGQYIDVGLVRQE